MGRILVVDNEPSILSVLSTLLKAEGYEVVPQRDSEMALEVVKSSEHFDVMVFDLRMVPIDGMQLLRAARTTHPATSVIILTAYGCHLSHHCVCYLTEVCC
jgi:CheY-like chemotaxis protein